MKQIISILFINFILFGTISNAQNRQDSILKIAYTKVIREYFNENYKLTEIENQMLKFGYLSLEVDIDSIGLPEYIKTIKLKYNENINFKDVVTNKGRKIFSFNHYFIGNDTIDISLRTKTYSGYLLDVGNSNEELKPAWTNMSFGEDLIRYFIYNKKTLSWDMYLENKVTKVK